MIYNIAIFDDISNSVGVALRSFFGHLVALIYNLIEYLYKLFDYISRAEILDNEFIQSIYSKVGLILGLFMLFKLVFSLVNSLISPDKLDDKKNGAVAIIKRSIISIVLLGITPTLFDEAFEIQRLLVGNSTGDNVLYKLISNSPTNAETEIGHTLATDLYLSFYTDYETPHLNNGTIDTIYDTDDEYYDRFKNDNFENLEFNLREGNISFGDTVDYLAIKNSENKYVIEFNWLVLLIVGVVVAWMMAMYCIQAATRVVQLAYLQLIAPVPILSYISDPEGSFKRWIKQCTSTYLDLFFRLAIIYFVMTMVKDVLDQFGKAGGIIFESTGIPTNENFTLALVKVLIILGLLLFAKRAPELLKELFPNLGKGPFSFGLNPKKELIEPLKSSVVGKLGAKAVKPIGTLTKKTFAGIDSKKNGYGFKEGWNSTKGSFGSWLDKQRQTYTPYSFDQSKKKIEGRKEVESIDTKWNDGVEIARKLMRNGSVAYSDTDPNAWNKALDGHTRGNYEIVFKNESFINSKMQLDHAKKDLDDLRDGLLQVQSGGTFLWNGTTYDSTNLADLSKLYNSQNSAVSGMESVHQSIRKQYADDAKREDAFKFIKGNDVNPATPSNTRTTSGI